MMPTMEVDMKSVKRVKKLLDPKPVKVAQYQAINETGKVVRKAYGDEFKEEYSLPVRRIRMAIKQRKATMRNPQTTIIFPGRTPGLQHYKAKQTIDSGGNTVNLSVSKHGGLAGRKLKRGKAKGVSVEVIKGQRRIVKGGFLQAMPGGGVGVFRRTGKKRLPIERLSGPSIRGMYKKQGRGLADKIVKTEMPRQFAIKYRRQLRKR